MRKVGVIGGGAIGLLLSAYLSKASNDVTVFTRTAEKANAINDHGITLQSYRRISTYKVSAQILTKERFTEQEVVFITVKQYDLQEVIEDIVSFGEPIPSLIFLQNGISHIDLIEQHQLALSNIYVGSVEHGALKTSANSVIHTGIGKIKIGSYKESPLKLISALATNLTEIGFETLIIDDAYNMLLKKLVVNGVINPLTTVFSVKNGQLVENSYFYQLMRTVFDEITTVFPYDEADWDNIVNICQRTAANRSSMLKDIEEGRRTEIDAITGYILAKAKEKQVHLPVQQFLYHSIKGLELQQRGNGNE